MSNMTFKEQIEKHNINPGDLASMCGVKEKTVLLYMQTNRPSKRMVAALEEMTAGEPTRIPRPSEAHEAVGPDFIVTANLADQGDEAVQKAIDDYGAALSKTHEWESYTLSFHPYINAGPAQESWKCFMPSPCRVHYDGVVKDQKIEGRITGLPLNKYLRIVELDTAPR